MAGSTAERTYFAADGGLASLGPVEQMSQQNAMTDNQRYPMAFQQTPTYGSTAARPVSQNVDSLYEDYLEAVANQRTAQQEDDLERAISRARTNRNTHEANMMRFRNNQMRP